MTAKTAIFYISQKANDINENKVWQDYIANLLWAPASEMKYNNMPKYSEYLAQLKAPKDDRTGDDIVNDVIDTFINRAG